MKLNYSLPPALNQTGPVYNLSTQKLVLVFERSEHPPKGLNHLNPSRRQLDYICRVQQKQARLVTTLKGSKTRRSKITNSFPRAAAGSRDALQVLAAIGRLLERAAVNVVAVEEVLGKQARGSSHQFAQAASRQLEASRNVQVLQSGEQVLVRQKQQAVVRDLEASRQVQKPQPGCPERLLLVGASRHVPRRLVAV